MIWNKAAEKWVRVQFLDDKFDGNQGSVMKETLQSIQHGVEDGMSVLGCQL